MVDLFSGAVKLADLNDFIAPSQACVVKLDDFKGKPPPSDFEVAQGGDICRSLWIIAMAI